MNFDKIKNDIRKDFIPVYLKEITILKLYLDKLKLDSDISNAICIQMNYHNLEKCFLCYNTYNLFKNEKNDIPKNIFIVCEMSTIPMIIFDDWVDKHEKRNDIQTLYGLCKEKYSENAAIFFGAINILNNYFIRRINSMKIDSEIKIQLINELLYAQNKIYIGGKKEIEIKKIENLDHLFDLYHNKAYHLFSYMPFAWGCILSKNKFDNKNLKNISKYLNILVQIRNDTKDYTYDINTKNVLSYYLIGKEKVVEIKKIVELLKLKITKEIEKLNEDFPDKKYYISSYLSYVDYVIDNIFYNLSMM